MSENVSAAESKKAQVAHEIFLFNLIFNHVFLFIATISAPSLQALTLVVPVLSVALIGFTVWNARRTAGSEPPFVSCHWSLAAKRSLMFGALWAGFALLTVLLLVMTGGEFEPKHYALGGFAFLPLMGTMLTLILLESEALQHARHRTLPRAAADRCRLRRASEVQA